MTARTVTRADLSEAVYQEVGLSRNESADLVESVLNEISDALVRGEMVKLSSFGSFAVRQKGERIGRNLEFAVRHRDIVRRFGRFPHRNELLGRESTAAEIEFLKQPGSSF